MSGDGQVHGVAPCKPTREEWHQQSWRHLLAVTYVAAVQVRSRWPGMSYSGSTEDVPCLH